MHIKENTISLKSVIRIIILGVLLTSFGVLVTGCAEAEKHETITSVSVENVADKFHNEDGYYLTVVLADDVVESYHLSYTQVSFPTGQRIYDMVFPEDDFTGVTLKITEIDNGSRFDPGSVLRERPTDSCEIVSVTKADNTIID